MPWTPHRRYLLAGEAEWFACWLRPEREQPESHKKEIGSLFAKETYRCWTLQFYVDELRILISLYMINIVTSKNTRPLISIKMSEKTCHQAFIKKITCSIHFLNRNRRFINIQACKVEIVSPEKRVQYTFPLIFAYFSISPSFERIKEIFEISF